MLRLCLVHSTFVNMPLNFSCLLFHISPQADSVSGGNSFGQDADVDAATTTSNKVQDHHVEEVGVQVCQFYLVCQ